MKHCPECDTELITDTIHCETYCPRCGLVVTSPVTHNGDSEVINYYPYNYYETKKPKPLHHLTNTPSSLITKYHHTIPNYLLMKKGMKK